MLALISFLVTIGILVTVHEYGHFQMAKWCGVKVLKFSIGFGKSIYSREVGVDKTEFSLNLLPLGGYVKMLDEKDFPVGSLPVNESVRAFNRQKLSKRIAIVVAGPALNFIFAILLLWALYMQGIVGLRPLLGDVPEGSLAAEASLKAGEFIKKVNGVSVDTWQDVEWVVLDKAFKSSVLEIEALNEGNEIHIHQLKLSSDTKSKIYAGSMLDQLGLQPYTPRVPAVIDTLVKGGVASLSGLKSGDTILKIDSFAIGNWDDFVEKIRASPNQKLNLEVLRNDKVLNLSLSPQSQLSNGSKVGFIGASPQINSNLLKKLTVEVRLNAYQAFLRALIKTWDTSLLSLKMLKGMLFGEVSISNLSGSLTVANYAGKSAELGINVFLGFLAFISISLGVVNLLPIPVLDGGHLMYYVVEFFKGSPISDAHMEIGQRLGVALIFIFMACALYNDFNRLIIG